MILFFHKIKNHQVSNINKYLSIIQKKKLSI